MEEVVNPKRGPIDSFSRVHRDHGQRYRRKSRIESRGHGTSLGRSRNVPIVDKIFAMELEEAFVALDKYGHSTWKKRGGKALGKRDVILRVFVIDTRET